MVEDQAGDAVGLDEGSHPEFGVILVEKDRVARGSAEGDGGNLEASVLLLVRGVSSVVVAVACVVDLGADFSSLPEPIRPPWLVPRFARQPHPARPRPRPQPPIVLHPPTRRPVRHQPPPRPPYSSPAAPAARISGPRRQRARHARRTRPGRGEASAGPGPRRSGGAARTGAPAGRTRVGRGGSSKVLVGCAVWVRSWPKIGPEGCKQRRR